MSGGQGVAPNSKNHLPKLPIHAKLNPINDSRTYQPRHKKGFYNGSVKDPV